jgi:hypothetical protein
MINFVSCSTIVKAHGWGTFSKFEVGLSYHLVLVPYFQNAPHPMALPYTEYLQLIGDLIKSPEDVKLLNAFWCDKKMSW